MTRTGLTSLLCAAAGAAAAAPTPAPTFARYVIVGAGPAGLQAAHYLDSAGRDYVVLDREAVAGSFFSTYPRWGELISVSKRHTGFTQLDVATRYD